MNWGALGELVLLLKCEQGEHDGLLHSTEWDLGVIPLLFSSWREGEGAMPICS